jgi:hypothetical protein
MVIVSRSLEAANAINAGNSKSLIVSVSMIDRPCASEPRRAVETTLRKLAVRLAQQNFMVR